MLDMHNHDNRKKRDFLIYTNNFMISTCINHNLYFQYAVQLSELLHFLEHHPLGSLALTNTYNSDFVIVNNKLKLVDLDDVAIEEKACRFNADCKIPGASQVSKLFV